MQQRRLRLGDILDDYCPRERRITNHAVVAMIDDEVKQTRCTTCDADHEYKQAKIPAPRRRKEGLVPLLPADVLQDDQPLDDVPAADETPVAVAAAAEATDSLSAEAEEADAVESPNEDDGPVHRRLIRATLPRPEGQTPERKIPEFTIRQPGGRGREFDGNRGGGGGQGQGRGRRAARGPQGHSGGQPSRFGGHRHDSPPGQRQNGNRPGTPGQRAGRPPGQSRGPGRKRGR